MVFFWSFLLVLITQRLIELMIANRNEKALRNKGALEYDSKGYRMIVSMHILFFLSLISEKSLRQTQLSSYWHILLAAFLLAQFLRYWAIISLGTRWNTKILVIPGAEPIKTGPYKYFRHPNYAAVIIELAVVPLIFSCYVTAAVFTTFNLLLLTRRVRIEEFEQNI